MDHLTGVGCRAKSLAKTDEFAQATVLEVQPRPDQHCKGDRGNALKYWMPYAHIARNRTSEIARQHYGPEKRRAWNDVDNGRREQSRADCDDRRFRIPKIR